MPTQIAPTLWGHTHVSVIVATAGMDLHVQVGRSQTCILRIIVLGATIFFGVGVAQKYTKVPI